MHINDQTFNIFIEEEHLTINQSQCKCALNGYESFDSISSSETYIEETNLFVKSCEEEVKVWDGKDHRSKGEVKEGEADEGGEQEAHTTKVKPFEESATKGEVSQEKVAKCFTNEGMKGLKVSEEVDPANHSTYVCDPASDSLSVHAELARLVVDVENKFTQSKPNTASA